jgi:peptidoglycan/LPS O-acetylase OafA/YrhL
MSLKYSAIKSVQLPALGYIPALDGLRAIAVILVMLTHANFQLGDNGILGVDMFFALSGFLITTLLLEENDRKLGISLKGFYVRRALRLFPALYTLLIVIFVYALYVKNEIEQKEIIQEVISSGLYLSNISWKWGWANKGLLLGHTWSLAVEEQFYLIWPCFLILALHFKSLRLLTLALICFIITCWILKLSGNLSTLWSALLHESIFIGCLAAILRWQGKLSFNIPDYLIFGSLLLIVIVGIFPFPWYLDLYKQGGRSLLALVTVFIIVGLAGQPSGFTNKLLSQPLLVGIGKISYAIYLWHVPVFHWFKWHSTLPPSMSFILKFILTFLLAGLSWILVEKKATQFGRTISKRLTS